MAYTEQRGQYWRGRYKLPRRADEKQKYGTISEDEFGLPFSDDTAAYEAALVKEVEARRAGPSWRDPRKGDITFEEWAELWWTAQDLEDTTRNRYQHLLKYLILPAFGHRTLNSIDSPEEIDSWELRIRETPKQVGRGTYSQRTAADARALLSTMLGDAAPSRISVNAAEKKRGRGRKSARTSRGAKSAEKVWATPLEALLVAERLALMSGRDDEFVLGVLVSFTGFRWGEAVGLETQYLRRKLRPNEPADLDQIDLGWQLKEVNGRFYKAPPKDESRRPVDKPQFLTELLAAHVERRPTGRCLCPDRRCGGSDYLFLSGSGGHLTRSYFGQHIWHPAVDGVHPEEFGKAPVPSLPVLVDGVTGGPLRPAWPYAVPGVGFEPPAGHGVPRFGAVDATVVRCPSLDCAAPPGSLCVSRTGRPTTQHRARVALADELGLGSRALATLLPLKPGLTPHSLRHSHQTWMRESRRVDPKLMAERMGHADARDGRSSMQEHYTHISPGMRRDLVKFLQELWERTLDERIALDGLAGREPGSQVALLDVLLKGRARCRVPVAVAPVGEKREMIMKFNGDFRTLNGQLRLVRPSTDPTVSAGQVREGPV